MKAPIPGNIHLEACWTGKDKEKDGEKIWSFAQELANSTDPHPVFAYEVAMRDGARFPRLPKGGGLDTSKAPAPSDFFAPGGWDGEKKVKKTYKEKDE